MRKQQDGFVLEQFMSPRAILRFRFIVARWKAPAATEFRYGHDWLW
jgi:hypothetical protein